jgi:hypothetical protein
MALEQLLRVVATRYNDRACTHPAADVPAGNCIIVRERSMAVSLANAYKVARMGEEL